MVGELLRINRNTGGAQHQLLKSGQWDDLRGEAQHTQVFPDVPAVEEFMEGQVGVRGGGGLRIQLCSGQTGQNSFYCVH